MVIKEKEDLKYVSKKNIPYNINSFLLLFYFGFEERIFFCSPGCPETCYIAQVGYKYVIHFDLGLLSAGVMDRYHHAQCHKYTGQRKKKARSTYDDEAETCAWLSWRTWS